MALLNYTVDIPGHSKAALPPPTAITLITNRKKLKQSANKSYFRHNAETSEIRSESHRQSEKQH